MQHASSTGRAAEKKLLAIPKQRRKTLLTVTAELHDPAAGNWVSGCPFQFGEARHQGGAERAGEMMAPLAPVEAGLAYRAARMGEHVGIDLKRPGHEALALCGQFDVVLVLAHELLPLHAVEHLHAEIACQMVVANPRAAQRRVLRSSADAHVTGAGGEPRKALEHPGDVGIGEAIVAVTALLFLLDQPATLELSEMGTCGLRRDAGLMGEFGCGQGAACHQRGEHVGAGGIADQRGDHGDIGTCFHTSMIAETSVLIKGVCFGLKVIAMNDTKVNLEVQMPVTVFIRYQLDPFKRGMFEEYARRWLAIIPKCGGDLVGYWMPHEGTNNIAFALISFENLAAYESYRARLRTDKEAMAAFGFAEEQRFILAEERTFLRKVTP